LSAVIPVLDCFDAVRGADCIDAVRAVRLVGNGAVHHLAWRVTDLDEELRVRRQVEEAGGRATEVIDRFWFKSVYFKEPGGVLFEIATEGPGFAVDEDPAHLGESLVLPPWFEASRPQIERVLPPLTMPVAK